MRETFKLNKTKPITLVQNIIFFFLVVNICDNIYVNKGGSLTF